MRFLVYFIGQKCLDDPENAWPDFWIGPLQHARLTDLQPVKWKMSDLIDVNRIAKLNSGLKFAHFFERVRCDVLSDSKSVMNIDPDPALPQEPDPEVVSEMNDEMLERVREVAHSIEDRVRKVTIDDLDSEKPDELGEPPETGVN